MAFVKAKVVFVKVVWINHNKKLSTRWPIRLRAVPTVTHSRACIPPSTNMLEEEGCQDDCERMWIWRQNNLATLE